MIKILLNNPSRIFFLSSLLILILLFLPIYQLENKYELSSYLFILLCYASAFFGLKFGSINLNKNTENNEIISLKNINKVLYIVRLLSIIGIILTSYEYFTVRGLVFTFDITQNKTAWFKSETTFLSMLAPIFETFSIFLLPIFFKKYKIYQDKKYFFSSILILFIHILFGVLLGSRVIIFLTIMIAFISYYYFFKLSVRYIVVFSISFIFLFGYIFSLRVGAYGLTLFDSLYYSGYSFLLSPKRDYIDNQLIDSFFLTSLYSFYLYLIHGIYEMSYLLETATIYYDFGKNLFWLPLKVISTIFDLELNPSNDNYRQGVYQTFISTFFRDFKYYSPIFIFMTFYIIAYPFKKLNSGNESWIFVVIILSLWIISSPFFSPFGSGPFSYCLAISLIIKIIIAYYTGCKDKIK